MAISWNTGTALSTGGTLVTTAAVTIPGGVAAGNVIIVAFSAFGANFQAAETVQASSTGTAPVLIGTAQSTAAFNSVILNAAIFSVVAGASDAGKVITGSLASADTAAWAVGLGAWAGASNSSPVDVQGVALATGNGSTITCPSETTNVASDWDLQVVCAALGGSAYTGGGGFTQREAVSDGSSGASVLIYDSNGSVGPAGTSIGGATFANAGNNSWWIGFTVGLAPAPAGAGPAYTASMSSM